MAQALSLPRRHSCRRLTVRNKYASRSQTPNPRGLVGKKSKTTPCSSSQQRRSTVQSKESRRGKLRACATARPISMVDIRGLRASRIDITMPRSECYSGRKCLSIIRTPRPSHAPPRRAVLRKALVSLVLISLLAHCGEAPPEPTPEPEAAPAINEIAAELVASDPSWGNTEGPAVDSKGNLYFTSRGTYKGIVHLECRRRAATVRRRGHHGGTRRPVDRR